MPSGTRIVAWTLSATLVVVRLSTEAHEREERTAQRFHDLRDAYLLGTDCGIYSSSNGVTWTQVLAPE